MKQPADNPGAAMTPERWRRITEVFHGALARQPDARAAFLSEACAADRDLRAQVDALLAGHRDAGEFGEVAVFSTGDVSAAARAPRRHPFVWVAWSAAAAMLALFAYAGVLLASDRPTHESMGWTEERHAGGWHVASVDPSGPAAAALQPGDRLIALDGVPPIGSAGTRFHVRALTGDQRYSLTVARGGVPRDLTLAASGGGSPFAGRFTHFLVSLVWCAVVLFIGLARPDRQLARLSCLAGLAVGQVFLEVGVIQSGFNVAPLHAVLGYAFFRRFPGGTAAGGAWSAAEAVLYATGGASVALGVWFASALHLGGLDAGFAHAGLLAPRDILAVSTFAAAVLAIVAVVPLRYRGLADEDQRRRIRWVAYGSCFALAPNFWYVAVNVLEGEVGPRLSLFANTSSVVIPVCMAYAVLKHRVLDIRVAIRRGLQYVLARRALQMAVALPVAVVAWAAVVHRHRTILEIASERTAYLLWMGAAGLALRFRRPLQVWLDRRFFREQLDREQLLLGLLDDAGRLESIPELSRMVAQKVDSALHPTAIYLWYRDPLELSASSSAEPLLTPPDLPAGAGWLAWLEASGDAAVLPAPDGAPLGQDEIDWLADHDVQLVVPITDRSDRLIGAVLVGPRKSEEPYREPDRRLLQGIARQVAVVCENLRLRARVTEERRIRRDVLAHLNGGLADLLKECPACGACFDGSTDRCERDGQPLRLSLPVTRVLDGRYRLERLIGTGGMGVVYQASDLRLDRSVAVKVLLGRAFGQPSALRRFRREAHTAARLNHPNIVGVYDFAPLEAQGAYLVMELVSGTTLRAELERSRVMPRATACDWFGQLLDGLGAAHAHGIVHRDLKPENVIGQLDPARGLRVKILDFGLAKFQAGAAGSWDTLTAKGVVLGTVGYMSPEQLLGAATDARSDLYAVGVMLFEALTGRKPFEGLARWDMATTPTPATLAGAAVDSPALAEVLLRCLARTPEQRFGSALALRDALTAALAPGPVMSGTTIPRR